MTLLFSFSNIIKPLQRFSVALGVVCLSLLSLPSQAAFQSQITQLKEVKNEEGLVNLEYRGKYLLQLPSFYVDVVQTYLVNGQEISIVKTSASQSCPVQYLFVVLDGDNVRTSPYFGNCSDYPKITTKNVGAQMTQVQLVFPSYQVNPKEAYIYEDGFLRLIGPNAQTVGPWLSID